MNCILFVQVFENKIIVFHEKKIDFVSWTEELVEIPFKNFIFQLRYNLLQICSVYVPNCIPKSNLQKWTI